MHGSRSDELQDEEPGAFTTAEFDLLREIDRYQNQRDKNAIRSIMLLREHGDLAAIAQTVDSALELAVIQLLRRSGGPQGIGFEGVLRLLRESLHDVDKELIVFVEELKVLGGIERALLEGFLDNRAAIGERPICRVRALLACTRGEWVATRRATSQRCNSD